MVSNPQITLKPSVVTSFTTGQANATHAGFSQTSTELPDSETIWSEYFNNVMRGSTDIDGTAVDASKTFSDADSTGDGPPSIVLYSPTSWPHGSTPGAAGNPAGGFVPAVGSPGVGGDASTIRKVPGFIRKMHALGHGTNRNGSCDNPYDTTLNQPSATDVATTTSPSYELGKYSS
jgi:hypothetical protein